MPRSADQAEVNAEAARLRARIAAIQRKTVANGCTEGEAAAAAEKLAQLQNRLAELDTAEAARIAEAQAEAARQVAAQRAAAARRVKATREAAEAQRRATEQADYERQALARAEAARQAEAMRRQTEQRQNANAVYWQPVFAVVEELHRQTEELRRQTAAMEAMNTQFNEAMAARQRQAAEAQRSAAEQVRPKFDAWAASPQADASRFSQGNFSMSQPWPQPVSSPIQSMHPALDQKMQADAQSFGQAITLAIGGAFFFPIGLALGIGVFLPALGILTIATLATSLTIALGIFYSAASVITLNPGFYLPKTFVVISALWSLFATDTPEHAGIVLILAGLPVLFFWVSRQELPPQGFQQGQANGSFF